LAEGRLRFAEPTDELLGRFRRIEIDQDGVPGVSVPATWIDWKSGAGRASFVDSAFEAAATERICRERFPSATVRAHPMTLREIFITLARAERATTPGLAP
jgi:ABC-2 type transport system ATP-binding protein